MLWIEPIDMPTSSATSLIVIRRSFITIFFSHFHRLLTCWSTRAFVIFNVFALILEMLIPLENTSFFFFLAHHRLFVTFHTLYYTLLQFIHFLNKQKSPSSYKHDEP
jgi:hypothetical protein